MLTSLKYFLILFFILFSSLIFAQEKLWSFVHETGLIGIRKVESQSNKKYKTVRLNELEFFNLLQTRATRQYDLQNTAFRIEFPDTNGELETFSVIETSILHPVLAKKFPGIKSYKGVGAEDQSKKISFVKSKFGISAMIHSRSGEILYIDKIQLEGYSSSNFYKVYKRKDLDIDEYKIQCLTENSDQINKLSLNKNFASDQKLRTYRLALPATGEYSQYHINLVNGNSASDIEKKEIVLAEMVKAISQINDVYENDLAVTFQLVENNDELIYLDPQKDPYTNDDRYKLLNENQTNCNNVLGSQNYDVGHVLSTNSDGGAALRGVICSSNKAKGVSGGSLPSGEFYYFDMIAHELGHQFGANHTFNGEAGSCSGIKQRNPATAVEPGSGSTLMAYAGLCSPQNVQLHSDFYFHSVSIEEIQNFIQNTGGSCALISELKENLFIPVVNAGADFNIPKSTPFKLIGQATDGDGDVISYCWEQIDNELNSVPPQSTDLIGTLYRSRIPSENNVRYFPELKEVTNSGIYSKWEMTPSVAREINFKLTVRDNNSEAGQTDSDEMKVQVIDNAGPFEVTSQSQEGTEWMMGISETITWNVAGTTSNGINVTNVNIRLSTDGGLTFDKVLLSNTANDGNESIIVPDISGSQCYVMVEAVNNIFYAVNTKSFSIGSFTEVCEDYLAEDTPKNIPDNNREGIVSFIIIDENILAEKVRVSVKVNHTYVRDLNIAIVSPLGTRVELMDKLGEQCNDSYQNIDAIFDDTGGELICSFTIPSITGVVKPLGSLSDFKNENVVGKWKLIVSDNYELDTGSLEAWQLNLCSSEEVLAIENNDLEKLLIYPNPSDGVLNVSFKKKEETVELKLFDLLGRIVVEKSFSDGDMNFNERIDFSEFSKGFYWLQIKNGRSYSVKKIGLN